MNPFHDNPLNSRLADGVARVGFRKWYERELLSSHAHMVLAILSLIALLASLEASRSGTIAERLMDVVFAVVSCGVTYWALRRYFVLLTGAEVVANQANCGDCGEYGRFRVLADHRHQQQTEVCCRKCNHRWVISTAD